MASGIARERCFIDWSGMPRFPVHPNLLSQVVPKMDGVWGVGVWVCVCVCGGGGGGGGGGLPKALCPGTPHGREKAR